MVWNIVVDSSCDLLSLPEAVPEVRFSRVPFHITIGDIDFVDSEGLDVPYMVDQMERASQVSRSACPSPGAWLEHFEQEGSVLAMTISSELSGSYNSAMAAQQTVLEDEPDKDIFVLDSRSTGPELVIALHKVLAMIREGRSFQEITQAAQQCVEDTQILFALSSFGNLVKNGRIGKVTGIIASKLKMWLIGAGSKLGTIELQHKICGEKQMLQKLLEELQSRCASAGHVVISHCQNPDLAEALKKKLQKLWKQARVDILPTSGLNSYYAERGGLIVAFSPA